MTERIWLRSNPAYGWISDAFGTYVIQLLEIVRLFRESVTLKSVEVSFRQDWKEMLAGETSPVSELWEGIDAK